jgi:hypothetical protein
MRLFLCRAGSACCQAGWWSNGLAEFIVASLMPAVNPAISGAADLPCRSGPGCLPLAGDFVRGTPMLDAAVKALSQMISPPMRSILWR